MDNDIQLNDYKTYEDMPLDKYNEEYKELLSYWNMFLAENDLQLEENKDYFIHEKNIYEIIRRVNKRRVYYKVFHNLDKINEFKRTAIMCYWINTLKPFMVVNEKCDIYNAPNEMFALYLIINIVRSSFKEIFPNEKFEYPSDRRIGDMLYNFKYCDLSREATIAFVETFADNYGIGIDYILNNKIVDKK